MDKNFIVLIVVVFFILGFSSCQKEGVYKPKERITSIYYADSNTDKYLCKKWNWDKKRLSTIDHLDKNGGIGFTEFFKYDDKKRIERIELDGNYYVQYKYNGNMLETMELYENNRLEESATVHNDGEKIDKIEFYNYYYDEYSKSNTKKISLLPKHILNKIAAYTEKSKSPTSIEAITFELTWEGNNVSKTKMYYTYNSEDYDYDENWNPIVTLYKCYEEETVTYLYDDKINPFYGFKDLGFIYAYDFGFDLEYEMEFGNYLSKNNIVSETHIYKDKMVPVNGGAEREYSDTIAVTRIITYDGKMPTGIIYTIPNDDYTMSVFYEYE